MRYLGSKDKLLPAIQSLLYEKGLLNHSFRFFDAFCGTGSVANSLKKYIKIQILKQPVRMVRSLLKRESAFAAFKRCYVREHAVEYPELQEYVLLDK